MPSFRSVVAILCRRWSAAPLIWLLLAMPALARAPKLVVPGPGEANPSGLTFTIDTSGLEANGYRPLRVEVAPSPGPSGVIAPWKRDRQVRVVIQPRSVHTTFTPAVTHFIDLPAGSASVTATVLIPQSCAWYGLGLKVYEGGEPLEDLWQDQLGWWNRNTWDWTEMRPTIVCVNRAVPPLATRDALIDARQANVSDPNPTFTLPDIQVLMRIFPDLASSRQPGAGPPMGPSASVSDANLLWLVDNLSRFKLVSPGELPHNWVEMSQVDVVMLSFDDLRLVQTDFAPQYKMLTLWLATGRLLVVYGAGEDFERLAEVEKLIDLAPLPEDPESSAKFRAWQPPAPEESEDEQSQPGVLAMLQTGRGLRSRETADQDREKNALLPPWRANPNFKAPFLWRTAGLGCVVAMAAENPFPGQSAQWRRVFSSVPDQYWRWAKRGGFSMHRNNNDYWKLLIPGVGDAPVWSFLILVSLFALVIGPLNYWLLRRASRLYLLLLTVPVGAIAMTLAIFAYALFTDGLAVRLRSRSFTELDQRTGRASSLAWQSYYAAIAPSQGLQFPADTTVFPISDDPDRRRTAAQMLVWDRGQQLRAGYLASRTATQFLVQRATTASERLVVRTRGASDDSLPVENQLGTHVRLLVVASSDGSLFAGENLASEASARLSRITPEAAAQKLAPMFEAARPDFPSGFDWRETRNSLSWLWARPRNWSGIDGNSPHPEMSKGLLEVRLAEASDPVKFKPLAGTYLAVVERSPAVPIGVHRVREEASLHILRGRYQ